MELADGPRREAVAARLLAGKSLLLDDQHAVPALGEPVRGRGARRTSTDDEHVATVVRARRSSTSRSRRDARLHVVRARDTCSERTASSMRRAPTACDGHPLAAGRSDVSRERYSQCAVGASSVVRKSNEPGRSAEPGRPAFRFASNRGDSGAMPDTVHEPARTPDPELPRLGSGVHGCRRAAHLGVGARSAIGIAIAFALVRRPKRSAEPATWAADDRRRDARVRDDDARVRRHARTSG